MIVRWAIRISVASLIIVVAALCAYGWYYSDKMPFPKTYTIGVVIPNFVHPYNEKNIRGMKIRTAVELFKEMYDDENSVLRKKILAGQDIAGVNIKFEIREEKLSEFHYCGKDSEQIANDLRNNDVVAVIGHMFNQQAEKVMHLYQSGGIPLISPKASDPGFARSCDLAFSMIYNDYLQAAVMAEYIKHRLTPQWVVFVYGERDGGRRRYNRLRKELQKQLTHFVPPKDFWDIEAEDICVKRSELTERYETCPNGLVVLFLPPWKAARAVTHLRTFLPRDLMIIAPDILTDEKVLESFSQQAARSKVPPPRLGTDKESRARRNGLSGYLIMVVDRVAWQRSGTRKITCLDCQDIEDSQLGANLWACSQAFSSKEDLENLATVSEELKHNGLLKGVFFCTDDCPCEVRTQLELAGFNSAKDIFQLRHHDKFVSELLSAQEKAPAMSRSRQHRKGAGKSAERPTGATKKLRRKFVRALRKEALRLKEDWAKQGAAFAAKDETYWEKLRLLVANPFFFEVAPVEAHEFAKKFRDKWKEKLSKKEQSSSCSLEDHPNVAPGLQFLGRAIAEFVEGLWYKLTEKPAPKDETNLYSLENDPNPTTDALLFVDAALLVTRAILSLPRHGNLSTDKQRTYVRDYLHNVQDKQVVKGFTGDLRFDKEGNRESEVLFSWIRNDRFRPSYDQFKLVSEQDYKRICADPDRSGDKPHE